MHACRSGPTGERTCSLLPGNEIVTVTSLESVLPIELLATQRYFCNCSVVLVKLSTSVETLPF